jgi:hypothetical protein
MDIRLRANYGYELIFEAENVKVVEDVETREYQKDERGKPNFNISPKRDISTDVLNKISILLDDLLYYRKDDFDSNGLVERLFDKLPSKVASDLAKKMFDSYYEESTD